MIGCAPRRRPTRRAVVSPVVMLVAATLLAVAAPASAQTSGRVRGDGSKFGKLLRAQTVACWSPPASAIQAGAAKRVVRLRFTLGRDGGLTSEPKIDNSDNDPAFKLLATSAVRVVKRCAPFKLPAASYEEWRDVIVNFSLSEEL